MISQKGVRENRGWLALTLTLVFFLVTLLVYSFNPFGKTILGTIQLVYCAASIFLVVLVFLFGVGWWSRFLPVDDGGDKAKPDGDTNKSPSSNSQKGGQDHAPAP